MLLPTLGPWHIFCFNEVELCLTIEIDKLIFLTMDGDLPFLPQVVLGIPLAMANRWCVFGKLNLILVFVHFSNLVIPVDERPRSYFLRTFCLCALVRYFLVQRSYCVDL